jgi:hypothetical protein
MLISIEALIGLGTCLNTLPQEHHATKDIRSRSTLQPIFLLGKCALVQAVEIIAMTIQNDKAPSPSREKAHSYGLVYPGISYRSACKVNTRS